ncbi:alkene reductase [Novosphingobium cyanobacteriorum]|uniref:Alkene reductase n=1 Tax=Novosphingobium cyanobacteriorum TaxID=3024215 RepID=A0ABT6CGA7_9SPHN|nr:alkene reductase [Novosphingobium cyanobacteriorum]MDF8332965.1 alkene reductase [Novosphingobium cyanobacteriorum]
MHDSLFQPGFLGAIAIPNRIIMAPLTRGRATPEHVPTPIMQTYYRQRATAGLILTEATGISREGLGWPGAPGIWSDQQVEAWKPIVEAVHEAGGRIAMQLWHMGRLVHPDFLGGKPGVSSSATRAPGPAHTPQGRKDNETARALRLDEIPRLIEDYGLAAENAKKAGFDGVQLHAANGYLIDQFLRDGANLRDDDYGGSTTNRVRLLREVTARLIEVWGADRVGVRLSPNGESQGVDDSNPQATFGEAARVLQDLGIAYLELRQPGPDGTYGKTDVPQQDGLIRTLFTGPLILNSDYTPEQADADIRSGRADVISFGRPFISNPDLVDRIAKGAHLNPNKGIPQTWYFPGEEGYTDYPTLAEEAASAA